MKKENDVKGVPVITPSGSTALTGPNAQAPAAGQAPAIPHAPDQADVMLYTSDQETKMCVAEMKYSMDTGLPVPPREMVVGKAVRDHLRPFVPSLVGTVPDLLKSLIAIRDVDGFQGWHPRYRDAIEMAESAIKKTEEVMEKLEPKPCVRAEAESPERSEDLQPQTDGEALRAGTPK
jgi:hypothetical protein